MGYSDLFSFYRSKEWETLRKVITLDRINKQGDLCCELCGLPIVKQYDAICHHIVPLDEVNVHDRSVSLNPDNIQVLHHRCHNKVHERWGYQSNVKKIMVVWGSPCAGKFDYVINSASANDLIIDIDRLYMAIGNGNRSAVKTNVLSTYRSLIDMVRTRTGKWRTAWVVRTLPLTIDRESIVKDLNGGELIHINTSKEECMVRAKERGREWVEWTEEYWKRYQEPSDR